MESHEGSGAAHLAMTTGECRQYVNTLDARDDELTEWEREFVNRMRGLTRPPTPLQADKLREIARRLGETPGGLTAKEEDLW